jgi:hypothetical protein
MKRIGIIAAIFIGYSSVPSAALAYEFNFLQNSPVAYYTDQDWTLYMATAKATLDHKKDGVKVPWKNSASGAGGYFIATKTTQKNGLTCRTLHSFNYGKQRTDASTYEVCRYSTGWKIPGDQ